MYLLFFIFLLSIIFSTEFCYSQWNSSTQKTVNALENEVELEKQFQKYRKTMKKVRSDNIKLLKQKKIIGLEYILAGPSQERPQSLFGHALIRFVDSDLDPYNDLVISFVANQDTRKLSLSKGILGGYNVTTNILTLGNFLRLYVMGEGRFLERYIIQSNQETIRNLKFKIQSDDFIKGTKYTFFNKNCARMALQFLKSGGFYQPTQLLPTIIPTEVPRHLTFMLANHLPPIKINSTYYFLEEIALVHGLDPKSLSSGNFSTKIIDYIEEHYDPEILARIFVELPFTKRDIRKYIIDKIIKLRKNNDLAWSLRKLPNLYYELCLSKDCSNNYLSNIKDFLGHDGIKWVRSKLREVYIKEGLKKYSSSQNPHLHWNYKIREGAINPYVQNTLLLLKQSRRYN